MRVDGQAHFRIFKIHIIDQNNLGHLESKYLNFEDEKSLLKKWQELIRENHYSLDMIQQDIRTASAFHF